MWIFKWLSQFLQKKKEKILLVNMIGNVSLLYMNLKNTDSFIILGIPICKHEMSLMDKYTWRYSSSRVTKEIKIKVSVATRMVKMKKKKPTQKYQVLWRKTTGLYIADRWDAIWCIHCGRLTVPSAAEHTQTNQLAIPFPEWPCAYRQVPQNSPGNGPHVPQR